MAAQGDNVEVAQILLSQGAEVDETSNDKLTPLHVAVHSGHVNIARLANTIIDESTFYQNSEILPEKLETWTSE